MEQTVQKALNLLEALVRSGQPRRLTELSRELGLTKPNVYRLLSTLTVLGYVKKDPNTSLYSPTLKLWEMGSMLVRDVDLQSVSGPRLRKLCDDSHESVQLAVWDGGYVVYVDKVDSAQPLKAITSIGSRVPARYLFGSAVNFAAHPTMYPAGTLKFSADFVGAMAKKKLPAKIHTHQRGSGLSYSRMPS